MISIMKLFFLTDIKKKKELLPVKRMCGILTDAIIIVLCIELR